MPPRTPLKLWISRSVLAAGLVSLAACSQSTHTDDVLLSGDTPVPKDAKYPDFSKPLTSAMDQMSDEEAKQQEAQLAALAGRRRAGTISDAEYWRRVNEMRKLKASMPAAPAN